MDKYNELRSLYDEFIYESYDIVDKVDSYKIIYNFEIKGLTKFSPNIEISKKYLNEFDDNINNLIFHIGLVELISYWKCSCPKNVIIKCGYINEEQIKFFKKLYYYGLGEFFYVNKIDTTIDDFMNITVLCDKKEIKKSTRKLDGCLIPIGGGKDSCVSLEILSGYNNKCFMINPKSPMLECAKIKGYEIDDIAIIKRTIDKKLIELNSLGYLNGHTPFSAYVAFSSYLMAYLTGKKYITLSNEGSANESTVIGTKINHQYSKTYEFESDFNNYTKKFFNIDIMYFSFLRPLSELQIAMLFSQYKKFHRVFKSCNVGSKSIPWTWCCNCAKCMFVYIILSPFLNKDELVEIFNEDLYDKESLLNYFIELTGNSLTKPFECVGTTREVRFCISYVIKKLISENKKLPYLLNYYYENYELSDTSVDILEEFNLENNLPEEFTYMLKEELEKCITKL